MVLCCDIDVDFDPLDHEKDHRVHILEEPKMRVTEAQNFMIRYHSKGHVLPISDDMIFKPNAIACAQYYLLEYFPDGDGVLGLKTENFDAKDTSVMLLGEKFIQRFPDRQVYFPGYKHFGADTELGEFAKSIGRFRFCPEAVVTHFHPVSGYPIDETHKHGRQYLREDLQLFEDRKQNKLVWGKA